MTLLELCCYVRGSKGRDDVAYVELVAVFRPEYFADGILFNYFSSVSFDLFAFFSNIPYEVDCRVVDDSLTPATIRVCDTSRGFYAELYPVFS